MGYGVLVRWRTVTGRLGACDGCVVVLWRPKGIKQRSRRGIGIVVDGSSEFEFRKWIHVEFASGQHRKAMICIVVEQHNFNPCMAPHHSNECFLNAFSNSKVRSGNSCWLSVVTWLESSVLSNRRRTMLCVDDVQYLAWLVAF